MLSQYCNSNIHKRSSLFFYISIQLSVNPSSSGHHKSWLEAKAGDAEFVSQAGSCPPTTTMADSDVDVRSFEELAFRLAQRAFQETCVASLLGLPR